MWRHPAVGGRVRLLLPRVCLFLAAAASMEVMDEQCRHERLGGGGLEDLEAEPVRAHVSADGVGDRVGRVDPAQRVGDHRPAQRRRAPAAVSRDGKGHPGRAVAAHRAPRSSSDHHGARIMVRRCRGRPGGSDSVLRARRRGARNVEDNTGEVLDADLRKPGESGPPIPAEEWSAAIAKQDAFNRKYQATGELIGAYGLADEVQAKLVRRENGQPAGDGRPVPGDQGVHRQLLPARLRERGARAADRGGYAVGGRGAGRVLADHA